MVAHNLVEAQMATQRYVFDVNAVKDMLKKGEWNRSILEIDFTNGMVFLQDKDKIVSAQPFTDFKKFVVSGEDFEDNVISLRFNQQQWQIMTQNSAEKSCVTHLLTAAAKDLSAEEAIASAPPTMLGLNKTVLRAGIMVRKAKTKYKKDERYLVLVPGKLFLFKNPELVGQHVRYVTSLMGASVKMLQGLDFEIEVPGTKSIGFCPDNVAEMTGWMGALERSVEIAANLLQGEPFTPPSPAPDAMNMGMNAGPSGSGNPPSMNLPKGQAIHFANVQTAGGRGKGVIAGLLNKPVPRVGGYGNPQDSRNVLQRLGQGGMNFQANPGAGGLKFQGNMGPGSYNPYLGGGNFQPPFVGGNFPAYNVQPDGNYGAQQAGPSNYPPQQMNMQAGPGQMPGQLYPNNFGQSNPGQNRNFQLGGFNQPQGNSMNNPQFNNTPGAYNQPQANRMENPQFNNVPGAYNQPQANRMNSPVNNSGQNMYNPGGQVPSQAGQYARQPAPQNPYPPQQDPAAPAGVRFLRRATQTLREFNNDMDQYLSTPNQASSSRPVQQAQAGGSDPRMAMNQSPAAAPSNDWQVYTSPDGKRYYHNSKTNQTSWEKPF